MSLFCTDQGLQRLEEKEKKLKEKVRSAGSEVGEAAGINCDWHDNAGYDEAKKNLEISSRRLQEIREAISTAVVLTLSEQSSLVRIGNTVRVTLVSPDGDEEEKEFTIGAYGETDIKSRLIAYDSPMAIALMAQAKGTVLEKVVIGNRVVDISIDEILPPSTKYAQLISEFYKKPAE